MGTRAVVAAITAIAACGPRATPPSTQGGPMSQQAAAAIVAERCGGCHDASRQDVPVLAGVVELAPALGADAVREVCAGDMPQDRALRREERDQVVAALCTLS